MNATSAETLDTEPVELNNKDFGALDAECQPGFFMTAVEDENLLRLVALDADDLAVLSANLQDALIPVPDLAYLPNEKRFALAGKRFDWVKAAAGGCERRATGLHFERVLGAALSGFARTEADRVLNLLAINFEPGDAPGGAVTLTFSGGAAIKLQVECIEAQMRDLGPRWACDKQPKHALETSP